MVLIASVYVNCIYFTFENGRNKKYIVYPCKSYFALVHAHCLYFTFENGRNKKINILYTHLNPIFCFSSYSLLIVYF